MQGAALRELLIAGSLLVMLRYRSARAVPGASAGDPRAIRNREGAGGIGKGPVETVRLLQQRVFSGGNRKMTQMKWTLLAASALLVASALPAQAQTKVIRWGDVVGGTHPSVLMIDRIAADVKAKASGRIDIQSFPGGQLGGSRDMIEAVANGVQQIVTEGAANFGAWVPSIVVVEAPYIWRDAEHLLKAMNGAIGEEFNEQLVKRAGCASSARRTTARGTSPRRARR